MRRPEPMARVPELASPEGTPVLVPCAHPIFGGGEAPGLDCEAVKPRALRASPCLQTGPLRLGHFTGVPVLALREQGDAMKYLNSTHQFRIDQSFYHIDDWEIKLIAAEATHLLICSHDGELGRQVLGYVVPYDNGELGINLFCRYATEGFVAVPLKTHALEDFKKQILASELGLDEECGVYLGTWRISWCAHLMWILHTIVRPRK